MPKWNGGVIGVANNPTISSAKGIWSLSEATKAIRAGLWPPSNAGADPYFENVTMLLSGDGTNGAQNNTFLDSSTNAFTITRNGNTTQGTFTPFSKNAGRWSNYFDGSGDYLTTSTTSTALAMGSGEFTIEAWIYTADTSFMIACSTTTGGCGFGYNIDNGTQGLWLGRAGTGVDATSGVQLAYNAWNHVAVTRDGSNVVKFWVNGTQSGSNTTVTSNYGTSAQAVRIAADSNASLFNLDGYLSNVRITKGAALYTATFTPSTIPLTTTVSSGTVSLLTCQSNRFIDNSVNAFALTANGTAAVQTFSPFPTLTAYASGTNGGSGYFDGTGDYLTVADNVAFEFGSGDFTVEGWFYALSVSSDVTIASKWTATGTASSNSWLLFVSSGIPTFLTSTNGSAVDVNISGGSVTANSWNHIAVSRNGSTYSLYLNGTRTATTTNSNSLADVTTVVAIGRYSGGTFGYMNGYISNTRIVKGTAVYTGASLTVPTSPLTAISGTSLLLSGTNGGIIDAAMSNVLETVGNAQISTTQSKFGGSSMFFDGTGDYLRAPRSPDYILSGDFTIEFWLYFTAHGNYGGIVSSANSNTANAPTAGWCVVFYSTTDKLYFEAQGGVGIQTTNALSTSTWTHCAIVRSGSTITHYTNGVANGSGTSSATFTPGTSDPLVIGSNRGFDSTMTGYIDDLRVTRGIARYTANFTAPTAPFNGFGD